MPSLQLSRGVGYDIVTGRGGGKVQKGTLGIRVGYKVTPELAPLLKLSSVFGVCDGFCLYLC